MDNFAITPPGKKSWKAGTMLYPLPAVLVSCGAEDETNIFTVAWTGIICTDPAMLSISVRPERYSFGLIKKYMQFTVNLTTAKMARDTDYCGVTSGRDIDKWKVCGLTPLPGVSNRCPLIEESPVSLECTVDSVIDLGSHSLFLARIVNVVVTESLIDPQTGKFELSSVSPLCYCHGGYYGLGEYLGHFGFSVRKDKKTKS